MKTPTYSNKTLRQLTPILTSLLLGASMATTALAQQPTAPTTTTSAPISAPAPAAQAGAPLAFKAYIGSKYGTKTQVILYNQNQLLYFTSTGDTDVDSVQPIVIIPTPEQWAAFYKVIDDNHIWQWRHNYYTRQHAPDGTSWRVTLILGNKNLNSGGYIQLPETGFPQFQKAVSELIGHPFE